MRQEVQFVVEFTIAEGALAKFKEEAKPIIDAVEAKEPSTVAYRWYFNADETKCYVIEWYNHADVIPAHLLHVGPQLKKMLEISKITRFEVFGNLNWAAKEALAAAGAVNYGFWEGFTRK